MQHTRRGWGAAPCVAGLPLLLALCGGCAFNDHGLVSTRHFQNQTVYAIELQTFGVHVLTVPGDSGLSIGSSKRLYFFRRDEKSAPTDQPLDLSPPEPLAPVPEQERKSLSSMGSPLAVMHETAGISIDAGSLGLGLQVGWDQRAALLLPMDSNCVLYLVVNNCDPALSAARLQEVPACIP